MKPEPIPPQPTQESVWDYPRPPRLEPTSKRIEVICQGIKILDTQKAYRVLETSHPPTYYFPPDDLEIKYFVTTNRTSFCEWKGTAVYYNIEIADKQIINAAWSYPNPTSQFTPIANYLGIYAQLMDACYVNSELVQPQPGQFYGGWITQDIVGPFKGEVGTWGW